MSDTPTPRAWLTSEPDGNEHDASFGGMVEGVELGAERPDCGTEPLFTQAQLDAAVLAESERCKRMCAEVIADEVLAERERCAQVAARFAGWCGYDAREVLARLIRSGKE